MVKNRYEREGESSAWNNGVDFGIAAAKGVAWTKVMVWNAVRLIIAGVFGILLLLFVLMGRQDGFDYGTNLWLVICGAVIVRNVWKTIKETRRVKALTTPTPLSQLNGYDDIIETTYREVPSGQHASNGPAGTSTSSGKVGWKYKTIRDEHGNEVVVKVPDP